MPLDAHVHNDIDLCNAFSACEVLIKLILQLMVLEKEQEFLHLQNLCSIDTSYKSPNDFRLDIFLDLSD